MNLKDRHDLDYKILALFANLTHVSVFSLSHIELANYSTGQLGASIKRLLAFGAIARDGQDSQGHPLYRLN